MNPTTRKLSRLLEDREPPDYTELDGFLGAIVIITVMAMAIFVAGLLIQWICQ